MEWKLDMIALPTTAKSASLDHLLVALYPV